MTTANVTINLYIENVPLAKLSAFLRDAGLGGGDNVVNVDARTAKPAAPETKPEEKAKTEKPPKTDAKADAKAAKAKAKKDAKAKADKEAADLLADGSDEITLDDLKGAVRKCMDSKAKGKGIELVKATFADLGAAKISDIPQERYAEIMEKLK